MHTTKELNMTGKELIAKLQQFSDLELELVAHTAKLTPLGKEHYLPVKAVSFGSVERILILVVE